MLGGPGPLNAGDIRFGVYYWDSPISGRRVYDVNGAMIPIGFGDNTVKLGNANAYALALGVAPQYAIPYTAANGAISWLYFGTSGTCVKFNGPTSAPTAETCGSGTTSVDWSNINITGGNITGVTIGTATYIGTQFFGAGSGNKARFYLDLGNMDDGRRMKWYTSETGSNTNDNVALAQVQVNDAGLTLETAQKIWAIVNYLTDLLSLNGAGDLTAAGLMKAAGFSSTAADGQKRLENFCNTVPITFTPQNGTIWCSTLDNNLYAHMAGTTRVVLSLAGDNTAPGSFCDTQAVAISQTDYDNDYESWTELGKYTRGQSFYVPSTFVLHSITVKGFVNSGSSNSIMRIGTSTDLTSYLAQSDTVNVSSASDQEHTFTFASRPTLNAGTTYVMGLTSDSSTDASAFRWDADQTANPYAGGTAWHSDDAAWEMVLEYPNADMYFKINACQ